MSTDDDYIYGHATEDNGEFCVSAVTRIAGILTYNCSFLKALVIKRSPLFSSEGHMLA